MRPQARPQPTPNADWIPIGQIVAPFGLKGGMKVEVLTDFPERFSPGRFVFVRGNRMTVKSSSEFGGQMRVFLSGITTPEQVEDLKWAFLEVAATSRPKMEPDEYLTKDLVGLKAVTPTGEVLGVVKSVVPAPAHDLLSIRDALIPAVKQFVKKVDLENGSIIIEPIPGMFDE